MSYVLYARTCIASIFKYYPMMSANILTSAILYQFQHIITYEF